MHALNRFAIAVVSAVFSLARLLRRRASQSRSAATGASSVARDPRPIQAIDQIVAREHDESGRHYAATTRSSRPTCRT